MRRSELIISCMLLLGGCVIASEAPAPKPVAQMTPQERCGAIFQAMSNPYLDPFLKMAAYEKARNMGCMGSAPPQRIEVDQTVRSGAPRQ